MKFFFLPLIISLTLTFVTSGGSSSKLRQARQKRETTIGGTKVLVSSNEDSYVFHGTANKSPVVLKFVLEGYGHEKQALSRLKQLIAFDDKSRIIVMKRAKGISVGEYLKTCDQECFAEMQDPMIKAASEMLDQGIIHKDSHLDNMFYDKETKSFTFIDFGQIELHETGSLSPSLKDDIIGQYLWYVETLWFRLGEPQSLTIQNEAYKVTGKLEVKCERLDNRFFFVGSLDLQSITDSSNLTLKLHLKSDHRLNDNAKHNSEYFEAGTKVWEVLSSWFIIQRNPYYSRWIVRPRCEPYVTGRDKDEDVKSFMQSASQKGVRFRDLETVDISQKFGYTNNDIEISDPWNFASIQ
jgi:serine/threonine protein kinase